MRLCFGLVALLLLSFDPLAARAQVGFAMPEIVFGHPGDGGDPGRFASIVHDSAGNLHAAYYEAIRGDLRYAFGQRDPTSGAFAWTLQTVDEEGDVGLFCDLALTLDGRPAISYHDRTAGALKVAFDENGDGDFEQNSPSPGFNPSGFAEIFTVDDTSPVIGLWTSIAIDDDNVIHVSYKDLIVGSLRYAMLQGSMWGIETADASSPQVGAYSSIVVDSRQALNVPYIFYQDETNLDLRAVRRLGPGAWFPVPSSGAIDDSGDTGFFIDALIRPQGDRIYVSYQTALPLAQGRNDLRLAIIDELAPPESDLVLSCSPSVVITCDLQILAGDFGYYTALTLDRNGFPVIAHHDNARGELILERRLTPDFAPMGIPPEDIWDLKLRPAQQGNTGLFASVGHFSYPEPSTMIPLETFHMAGYAESRRALEISAVVNDRITTSSVRFIDGAKAGEFSSIALDSNSTPVVAYYDGAEGSLYLALRDGPPADPWSSRILLDNSDTYRSEGLGFLDDPKRLPFTGYSESGLHVSMVLDAADTAHVAFHDSLRRQLRYLTYGTSSTQSAFFTIDDGPDRGTFASLALSPDGSTYAVAYFQDFSPTIQSGVFNDPIGNGPRLRVAIGDGATTWTIESVDTAGRVGEHSSIVFDDSGRLHVAYLDATNFNLKYATRVGSSWQVQTVLDSLEVDGLYTSIAINPINALPAIAFHDASNSRLRFAQYTGNSWLITTVDDDGDVGLYPSLRFDPQFNFASIAYYDLGEGALKVAAKSAITSAWNFVRTIDSEGDVGLRPSLAVDGEGRLKISYYDSTRGDLRYVEGLGFPLNRTRPAWRLYR